VPFARTLGAALLALLASACGAARAPCRSESACPDGTVCESSGLCVPLALDPVIRTARATWLLPIATRVFPESADAGDAVRLGGEAHGTLYLSFSPLPADAGEATAALVLTPHASFTHPTGDLTLLVDRVRPILAAHGLPAVIQGEAGTRALGNNSRGVVRIDLTELVREASRDGVRTLDLSVRADGDAVLRIASDASIERGARPRLEVLVP
jgi:hypothetical protein